MKSPFFFLLLLFLSGFGERLNAQGMLLPTTLEQRLFEAELIVEGKVVDQYSFWGKAGNMIYTANEIELYKIFKGNIVAQTVEIITTGGIVGGQMITVDPSLKLEKNQIGVFILKQYAGTKIDDSRSQIWRPVAETAAFLAYDPERENVKDVFESRSITRTKLYQRIERSTGNSFHEINAFPALNHNRLMMPSISSISPLTVSAGTETLITISGSGFGGSQGTVYFDYADDGPGGSFISTASYHIQSWSSSTITAWVPSGAGTGNIVVEHSGGGFSPFSTDVLTITYGISNVEDGGVYSRTYLIDDMCDGDGGYLFAYSTNTSNNGVDFTAEDGGNAQTSFERALNSWQGDVGFAAFAGATCGTTSIQTTGNDGVNVIGFDSDAWDLDVESSSSTLAVTYSQFSSCGASEWEVSGLDLIFRRDGDPNGMGGSVTWEYGGNDGSVFPSAGESDFESVALHELGHATQLGHTIDNGGVMHYAISTGTHNRVLGAGEISGGNDVETESVAYTPPYVNCNPAGDFVCVRQYAVYSAGNDCALLPVELTTFNGKRVDQAVQLNWETATEINNDFFTLERSVDGRNYEIIATVKGQGTSFENSFYEYFDGKPATGVNYYRLTQTDFDGKFEVFDKIVALEFEGATNAAIRPNPVRGDAFQLVYNASHSGDLNVEIYSITGQLLYNDILKAEKKTNYFDISLSGLSNGVYVVKTSQNNVVKNVRFVKTK